MRRAIYPGSFDPITFGHVDIIERGSALFDELVVSVSGQSRAKHFTFSEEERIDFIVRCVKDLPNVTVIPFEGLLTSFAHVRDANVIIRGLRAISDFEYEFQMASMNRKLAPDVETVFMMTRTQFSFLSSSVVKEIASYGGDIGCLVPPQIAGDILAKLSKRDA